jgi:hypothetical protein
MASPASFSQHMVRPHDEHGLEAGTPMNSRRRSRRQDVNTTATSDAEPSILVFENFAGILFASTIHRHCSAKGAEKCADRLGPLTA